MIRNVYITRQGKKKSKLQNIHGKDNKLITMQLESIHGSPVSFLLKIKRAGKPFEILFSTEGGYQLLS